MPFSAPQPISEAEAAGLADFWLVYDARLPELEAVSVEAARRDPEFQRLSADFTPERIAAERAQNLAAFTRLRAGDWEPYAGYLRGLARGYARRGVTFAGWHRLLRARARAMSAFLVRAWPTQPARLEGALLGKSLFFDWCTGVLGEAFVREKEAAAQASEQDLATTLDSIGDAVITADLEGCVQRLNPVAQRLTGYSEAEARGRPLAEIVQLTDAPGAPGLALRARDGTVRFISQSSAPLGDGAGGTRGVVKVLHDRTGQLTAEAALRRSEGRFARLLQSGLLGIFEMDLGGQLLDANDTFLSLVGREREALRAGLLHRDQLTPAQWRPLDEAAMKAAALHGVSGLREKEFLRADGSRVPVLVGSAMLDDASAIVFVLDISRQKQLEAFRVRSAELEAENRKIQEANRLKSEFLANMSHELRTPLNSIIGFTELMFDDQVKPEAPQFKEFLGDILASGRHLLQLINDVLDLAKVEAGRLEFHPEPVDLTRALGEVVALLRTPAAQKRLTVSVEVHPEVRRACLDPSRLKQVLYNYVSNALKFTGEGGRVTVRARPESSAFFRLEVEDTGIGIAPEDLGRLFTEFQQLDGGANKQHPGTGLGLALTRRLAQAQGGEVGVTSVKGEGSTFFAVLPRAAARGPALPQQRRIEGPTDAPAVLVIEDNARDQALIVNALVAAGYAVETASSGAEAVACCARRAFEAITLDLLLPDTDGLEVLRAIRAGELNREVPVIVISVVTEQGAAAGYAVHDLLAKPLEPAAMLGSLERAGVRAGKPGLVLVVEDDPGSARLMAASLESLGYRCQAVERGRDGLELASAAPPLAVILDLLMPEMDGFEFLERFRRVPRCQQVPVLVWTMKDLTAAERRRLEHSVHGVLQKGQDAGSAVLEALRAFLPPGEARA